MDDDSLGMHELAKNMPANTSDTCSNDNKDSQPAQGIPSENQDSANESNQNSQSLNEENVSSEKGIETDSNLSSIKVVQDVVQYMSNSSQLPLETQDLSSEDKDESPLQSESHQVKQSSKEENIKKVGDKNIIKDSEQAFEGKKCITETKKIAELEPATSEKNIEDINSASKSTEKTEIKSANSEQDIKELEPVTEAKSVDEMETTSEKQNVDEIEPVTVEEKNTELLEPSTGEKNIFEIEPLVVEKNVDDLEHSTEKPNNEESNIQETNEDLNTNKGVELEIMDSGETPKAQQSTSSNVTTNETNEDLDTNKGVELETMDTGETCKDVGQVENSDSSLDKSNKPEDKEKDEPVANTIEYVELSNSIEEDDGLRENDTDKNNTTSSLVNSVQEIIDENPLSIGKEGTEKENSNKDYIEDDLIADADDLITDNQEGADEELCIIPDTERVLSQVLSNALLGAELVPLEPKVILKFNAEMLEEKEAAVSIPPLRDISEASSTSDSSQTADTRAPASSHDQFEYTVSPCNIEDLQTCKECVLKRKVKYSLSQRNTAETQYICNDSCLEVFKKANEMNYFLNWEQIRVRDLNQSGAADSKLTLDRICCFCNNKTTDDENNLTWELMDFCNEICLWKYQKKIGSTCSSCNTEVSPNSLGKYCVRFGEDIRQFCSSHCLEEYKKGLKVCSYCQQDMTKNSEGFLAPVGDKGQFKDFCTQQCMEKYDIMTNNKPPKVDSETKCSVCKTDNQITIEFETNNVQNYFCSDRCFVAFSFVNNITSVKCSMCRRYFNSELLQRRTVFYDNVQYSFCSNSCQNIYIIAHRKIVPCVWCKVKKYNFDMIRRYFRTGQVLNMCSINCFNLFQVSVNAVNSKKTICNFCNKRLQSMYHLTMSDASIRNFCSYTCVLAFQNKFKKSPITLNKDDPAMFPVPTGEPKKTRRFTFAEAPNCVPAKPTSPPLPIISNVQSLANKNGKYNAAQNSVRQKKNQPSNTQSLNLITNMTTTNTEPPKVKHHIIIKLPPMPDQRNVATMCKVKSQNKGTSMKPVTLEKGIQTDKREAEKILIPVPVPLYVPSPLPMYSVPIPYPLPFPIPIPVPVFIPTTRNSAKGIMKEIKKIQVKIPTDPYEAELLMMAEMVAGDKKEENTDSESEVDDAAAGAEEGNYSPEPVDASNTFGDDMLQMALKMATELEEPAVDLEGALTANTITASQSGGSQSETAANDSPPILQIADRQTYRGRKRGSRGGKLHSNTKKRRMSQPGDSVVPIAQPAPPSEPAEKPDAHLCLKYTFGVNAWKQWVTTKNQAEIEKSSKYVKPFKTEILQLTADELNYSLCLFVKEVRKPNGAEYAPDTIYYLCLGIQQYLFENGRIDNIFCDPYYEQFTDSLDEVARKFSVLYNDSHYIVTRVEEEHLWESKQLGAHSPHVLLSTLMFFNTKHFNLTTVQEHMQLSFSHIMKHWKRNPNQGGVSRTPGSRNVLLRFYPPQTAMQNNTRKKKVYEQQENDENPLRCPVKLYEFYLSKCPESVKTRNDVFYLQPERSCVPDSPVWYSTTALAQEALEKMLHRVKMVKEINVALLTS